MSSMPILRQITPRSIDDTRTLPPLPPSPLLSPLLSPPRRRNNSITINHNIENYADIMIYSFTCGMIVGFAGTLLVNFVINKK